MPLICTDLLNERRGEKYGLHERHFNAQMVARAQDHRLRRGFRQRRRTVPRRTCRGARYLDLLSGFGVFAIGRKTIRRSSTP